MNGQAGDDPINNPNHNPSVGKSEGLWYNFQEGDLGLDQGYNSLLLIRLGLP